MRPGDKEKVAWTRTKGQLPVAVLTIVLNLVVLFVGGGVLLAAGVYGMTEQLGTDPGALQRAHTNYD